MSLIKPVFSTTRYVPSQYSTIQAAVLAAQAGDIIQVAGDRTYYEHVWINKTLTILGENPQTTIVDGNGTGPCFDIEDAVNVVISGFTIQNAGNNSSGVISEREFAGNSNNRIENNIIKNGLYGISLTGSDNNKILNNTIYDNPLGGILISNSDGTNATGNAISESMHGIRVALSFDTKIVGNTITQTSNGIDITSGSTGTIISYNTITGVSNGIYSNSDSNTIDHNTITNGAVGVYLYGSRNSQIHYNTITIPHGTGIKFYHTATTTATHQVTNNKILKADWAIHMTNSYNNVLWGNWVQDNTNLVYLAASSSNTFYRNNFINNIQAYIAGTNYWDLSGNGNHWSDHTSPDTDGNGIVDTSYTVAPNNIDDYPLTYTWSQHDITVQSVTPSATEVNPGTIVTITVTVKNIANISSTETFTVTTKYNNTIISTQQVTALAQGAARILTFNWDTTGLQSGNYIINAEASTVTEELNTENNKRTGDTVKIKVPLIGDINSDGKINNADLILLMQAYGSSVGESTWNPNADLDGDNKITIADLGILGKNYSSTN